jgi:hypothetical protein
MLFIIIIIIGILSHTVGIKRTVYIATMGIAITRATVIITSGHQLCATRHLRAISGAASIDRAMGTPV